ncbi:hypothetical protein A3A64_03135 [Candidatus Gottesmanbacteria bacterium RIFCSPLOWO2_01_FULL_48_11]|uniref:Addiction module toxin RelE n=1 Tax=Candidatus Gottesmanbacteria bacterium RIFCSPLOWO2_01_FULL_48_11 TaxID=1798395 RepID=A0A1F6ATZ5_9BACT|nr:MAG: hypothetical protein A3A64_03135 [Candidatus Gottesmanbacteria bacterium RIFCSPLOWO2_01_FULL_48_11]
MKVILSPRAKKQYKRIGAKDRPKIARKINLLAKNPLEGKRLEGEYKGEYSLRVWPLRIIYTFNPDQQVIEIEDIDYRGSVYKN